MRKTSVFIFILFLFFQNFCSYAQTEIRLSKPRLELEDNNLVISYDILNSKQTDKFRIWIEITDSIGQNINARSLSGDIGENVLGGNNKKITWNLKADNISLDIGIYVQVYAEILTSDESYESILPVVEISRSGAIMQSLIFWC